MGILSSKICLSAIFFKFLAAPSSARPLDGLLVYKDLFVGYSPASHP
jgi:hypothetical protein